MRGDSESLLGEVIRRCFILFLEIIIDLLDLLPLKDLFNWSQIVRLALTWQLILNRVDLSELRALSHPILLRFTTLLALFVIICECNIVAADLRDVVLVVK